MTLDMGPVDIVAKARLAGYGQDSALDGELAELLEIGDLLRVDDELLVVIVDADGGAELSVGQPHAVDLASHAVAVGKMGDLHRAGEAALEVGVDTRHVERTHLDPCRHVP